MEIPNIGASSALIKLTQERIRLDEKKLHRQAEMETGGMLGSKDTCETLPSRSPKPAFHGPITRFSSHAA